MAYNGNDSGDSLGNALGSLGNKAKNAIGNKIKKRTRNVTQKAARAAGRMAKAMIKKLIAFIIAHAVPILIIFFLLLLFLGLLNLQVNTPGTTNNVTQDINHQNPMAYDEKGDLNAVALVEPQAMKDAYYKYMACRSYRKLVIDGTDEIWLEFDYENPEMYQDFAGLMDYNDAENQYYLSSEFILYADRMLHTDTFYFPEQVIKPVKWEINDDGFVVAVPLTDDDRVLTAESHIYKPDASVADAEFVKKSDTETALGVWDYGMGTILQYESFLLDKWLEYTIESIDVESVVVDAAGNVVTDADGNPVFEILYEQPLDAIVKSPILIPATYLQDEAGNVITDAAGQPLIDVPEHYEYEEVAAISFIPVPISDTLRNLPLEPENVLIGRREFNNTTLNELFGNGGATTYPVKIPVVKSAATLSGNTTYTYNANPMPFGFQDATSDDILSDCAKIEYKTAISNPGQKLVYHRTGNIYQTLPTPTIEENPWGFDYIEDYTTHYVSYPPETVTQDLNFETRMTEELTDFLKKLGLLVPYGSASGQYNPWAPCGLTADELDQIIDLYLNGYGGKSLKGMGQALLDMETTYEVNALFALGVAAQEQQLGKANNIHTNNNNFFSFVGSGTGGTWISDSGRHWAVWTSPEDAINAFGNNLRNKFNYYGRTIYGIGQIYCPNSEVAGQANGWAAGIMQMMNQFLGYIGQTMEVDPETEYQVEETGELYVEGFESGEMTTASSNKNVVVDNPYGYPLYKIRAFDIRTATSVLQKSVGPADENEGLLEALAKAIGKTVSDLVDAVARLTGIAEALDKYNIKAIDAEAICKHIFWRNYLSEERSHMIIYQTYAAIRAQTIDDVKAELDQLDPRSIYLFVGKIMGASDSSIFGMDLLPSIGTTIDGAVSPTDNYYPVSEPYDPSKGGMEMSVPSGTVVKAIADGVVKDIIPSPGGVGTSIVIEYTINGKKYTTTYGYLTNTMGLAVGDTVTKGQIVGETGKNASGQDSLFFGVTENGVNKNPSDLFYQASTSGGVGFYNLLNADGTANQSAMDQLAKMILEANWFYPTGSASRITNYTNSGWIYCEKYRGGYGTGWTNGRASQFDKWHNHKSGINVLQPWQCTWWANGRASEYLESYGTKYKKYPTQGGNGGDYYDYNRNNGWFQGSATVPHAPALVSWKTSSYGHVAFVEAVLPDGRIIISEAGSGKGFGGVKVVDPNHYSSYRLSGYIYLDQPL